MGTVRGVAKMGYQCVEFYSPYYDWTTEYARQGSRRIGWTRHPLLLDSQRFEFLYPAGVGKAIELNKILGTRYIVLAHPGEVKRPGWLQARGGNPEQGQRNHEGQGLHAGYHNHDAEWKPIDGQKPMEVLAAAFDKSIMLQLDVGTCVAAGGDPVAWINRNPGRIRSMHVKDWSPQKQYKVLTGEGIAPWKKMFAAAEKVGGIEYYLIEQEGSDYPEMETAQRCLAAFHKLHG